MSEKAERPSGGGVDFLYGVRLFLLSLSIAGILESLVTVSRWARFLLGRWSDVRQFLSETVGNALSSIFHVRLNFFTLRILPTLLVMLAVLGMGVARRQWGRPRAASVLSDKLFWPTRAVAYLMLVALGQISTAWGPQTDGTPGWNEYHRQCSSIAHKLTAACFEQFQKLDAPMSAGDVAIQNLYLLLSVVIVAMFAEDFIAAFIAATLFLALGMIDLRPLLGAG